MNERPKVDRSLQPPRAGSPRGTATESHTAVSVDLASGGRAFTVVPDKVKFRHLDMWLTLPPLRGASTPRR